MACLVELILKNNKSELLEIKIMVAKFVFSVEELKIRLGKPPRE